MPDPDPFARPLLPIACTLGVDEGRQRIEDWRAVVRRSGTSTMRDPGVITIEFRDGPEVGAQLTRLVNAERDCCAFLGWELLRTDAGWALRITGTDDELATVSLGQ